MRAAKRHGRSDFRMHFIGHVECHIAVALDQHLRALRRNRIRVVALPLEFQANRRIFIQQNHIRAGIPRWRRGADRC